MVASVMVAAVVTEMQKRLENLPFEDPEWVKRWDPAISCLAKPWPQPALPSAIGCLGTRDALDADAQLIQHALNAATTPGATPRDIIASAATD